MAWCGLPAPTSVVCQVVLYGALDRPASTACGWAGIVALLESQLVQGFLTDSAWAGCNRLGSNRCRVSAGLLRLPAAGRLVQRGAGLAAVGVEPAAVRAGHALLRGRRVRRGPPAAAAAHLPVRINPQPLTPVHAGHAHLRGRRVWRGPPAAAAAHLPVRPAGHAWSSAALHSRHGSRMLMQRRALSPGSSPRWT